MKKQSRNKYLLKNTIIFGIGNFGSKLITFFLVPLYTNVLTVAEYGTIDLVNVISTVIIPLISLNIAEAIMRYSMDKEYDQNEILKLGINISFIASIICLLSYPFLKKYSYTSDYAIYLTLYTITSMVSHIFLYAIRGREKLMDYSIISICQTFMIALFNIIFLVIMKTGIVGYLLAYIISNFATIILCSSKLNIISVLKKTSINKKIAKEMIKYSAILIPNSLMWWIMNSLDRIMITAMINVNANGIYAISYKIPTIVITITTIFNQAWMFSAVKEKESKDKSEYTNSVYTSLFYIIITLSTALMLILKPLLSIYVGHNFFQAWKYTPALIIGTVFLTLATFISNEYTAHKDSLGFLKSSSIGAITNLTLNYILIPLKGIQGAAIATCISYIVVYIYRAFDTKKYAKLKLVDNKKCFCIILLIISSVFVYINNINSYFLNGIVLFTQIFLTRELWINIYTNIKKIIVKFLKNKEKI